MISWLGTHKFETHLVAFSLMILASIGLYFTANDSMTGLTWILLGMFTLANILAMLTK